jgi:hypothetical protein
LRLIVKTTLLLAFLSVGATINSMPLDAEGLLVPPNAPPIDVIPENGHAVIPSDACYVMGQFVRFMDEFADDAIADVVPDLGDQNVETALSVRDIGHDVLGACGRV